MIRGHSRHSYPFDKMIPNNIGNNSVQKQVSKKMHKKKQHQYDKKLEYK